MAGLFPPPKAFTDWLKVITEAKAGWDLRDYRNSWLVGARMLLESGTTTVVDIEAVPEMLPRCWNLTPLRVFSLLEIIGIGRQRQPLAVLREALQKAESLDHACCRVGLSPHAPYTTVPSLLKCAATESHRRRMPLCIHVAESFPEYQMFHSAVGEMYDWIRRSGRNMEDCGATTPVQHLARCGALRTNLLATHANYLGRGDATLLARNGVSVVHCPRSHQYFRHDPFPLGRLRRTGVNICLGTDSLASVLKSGSQDVCLSLFEEMRTLSASQPWVSSRVLVEMATINGARALGLQSRLGSIVPGTSADLIALPLRSTPRNVYDHIVAHTGRVSASMINGQWALTPTV